MLPEICPTCGKKLPESLEVNFCPYCGVSFVEPAAAPHAAEESEPAGEESAPREGIPWENAWLPLAQRLTQTWTDSLFRPVAFFKNMPITGGIALALLYALIFEIAGNAFYAYWQQALISKVQDYMWDIPPEFQSLFSMEFHNQLILAPLFGIIGLFLAAAIYHVSLLILGAAKNGFEATFRSIAYAQGPLLFYVVPVVGWLVGWVWSMVLMIIGFRETQETSSTKAVMGVLLPFFVCCGLLTMMVLVFTVALKR